MDTRTTGELISTLRKEKGLTQKEVAERLGITDKAVSKWERDLSYPDTAILPRLAELLGVTVEELLRAKGQSVPVQNKGNALLCLILKAIPTAMGVALTVTALLGTLDVKAGFAMGGIALTCIGIFLLRGEA